MKIIIEENVMTAKNNFFAYPHYTFKNQSIPTKCFVIPLQQREYDWPNEDPNNISELISDLNEHLKNNYSKGEIPQLPATNDKYYFSGTILCENQNNDRLNLVDGQQRITTLFLLNYTAYLLAKFRIKNMPPINPSLYELELSKRFNEFVKWENRCFITSSLKQELVDLFQDTGDNIYKANKKNENSTQKIGSQILERIGSSEDGQNNNYWNNIKFRLDFLDEKVIKPLFEDAIKNSEFTSKNGNIEFELSASQSKKNPYKKAINIILRKLADIEIDGAITPDQLSDIYIKYIEYYIGHISMTCIISDNENDSFTLFEILNERGKEITALDLLKNLIKEREATSGLIINEFEMRWKKIKSNVNEMGTRGKADSSFVKFFIRSEGNTGDKKQISYLRTNEFSSLNERCEVFCREKITEFFLRLEKSSSIMHEIYINSKPNNNTNHSPFDKDPHSCFQYVTFMRMFGYDWGQQVVLGSNLLHLYRSGYSQSPNQSYSLNDNHEHNWKNSNSNPTYPDLKHFQRFLGDVLLKIGLVGIINKLVSSKLPNCSRQIIDVIIKNVENNKQNCCDKDKIKEMIQQITGIASSILDKNNQLEFNENLKSQFLADSSSKRNIAKIILFIIYSRKSSIAFNCPELEHFEPNVEKFNSPPYYNKGNRSILINRLGNFFLIDRAINNQFSNMPIIEKLKLIENDYSQNNMFMLDLFQNVNILNPNPVNFDKIHGQLPLIKVAKSDVPEFDDSFEMNNTPTEYFFNARTSLISDLITKYIFENGRFLKDGESY